MKRTPLFICLLLLKGNKQQTPRLLKMSVTFAFVTLGWILFRSETVSMAFAYITDMFSSSLLKVPKVSGINNVIALISLFFIALMLCIEWKNRDKLFGLDLSAVRSIWIRYSLYMVILVSIYFFGNNSSDFIYFQF